MSTDFGTDVKALLDLPDPEELVSGEENVAYAQARRLLTPSGALEDLGDTEEYYDCINLRDALASRPTPQERADLEVQANQVLSQDERVLSASAELSIEGSALKVEVESEGAEGPFGLVLSIDGVSSAVLKVT